MAGEPLPTYRYHPDPIATGSIEPSDGECEACGRSRGFIYAGPVYAEDELVEAFCRSRSAGCTTAATAWPTTSRRSRRTGHRRCLVCGRHLADSDCD